MTARPRPTAGGGKKWLSAGAGQGPGRLSFCVLTKKELPEKLVFSFGWFFGIWEC